MSAGRYGPERTVPDPLTATERAVLRQARCDQSRGCAIDDDSARFLLATLDRIASRGESDPLTENERGLVEIARDEQAHFLVRVGYKSRHLVPIIDGLVRRSH